MTIRRATVFILASAAICGFGHRAWASESTEAIPELPFEAQASAATEKPQAPASEAGGASAAIADWSAPNVPTEGLLAEPTDKESFFEKLLASMADFVPAADPGSRDKLVLTLSTFVGYDTNVLYSVNKIKSATAGGNAVLDYKFGSRRLQIEAQLSGGTTYYDKRPSDHDDQNYQLLLALNYKLSPRLSVELNTNTAYLSQPQPQLIGGIPQYSGSYYYTNTSVNLEYALRPRLSLSVGFGYNAYKYEDKAINEFSGYSQENYSLAANFLLAPRSTLVFQYRYNPLHYNMDGLGSDGHYLTVGLEQTLTPRLFFSLSGGAEYRKLKNSTENGKSSYLGPFVEGALTYNAGPTLQVKGTMRFGTEPSGAANVAIRTTFRTGLTVSKSFGDHLDLSAGVYYSQDHYDEPSPASDYVQSYASGSVDLRYHFTTWIALAAHYDYMSFTANVPNSDYTRGYSTLGLEVTF